MFDSLDHVNNYFFVILRAKNKQAAVPQSRPFFIDFGIGCLSILNTAAYCYSTFSVSAFISFFGRIFDGLLDTIGGKFRSKWRPMSPKRDQNVEKIDRWGSHELPLRMQCAAWKAHQLPTIPLLLPQGVI